MEFRKNRKKIVKVATVLLVVLGLVAIGSIAAKYVRRVSVTGNVELSMELIDSLKLVESEAARQPDGTYDLDETVEVLENTYTFMPGVDIPKDPHFVLTGKTPVDAYLYVEVLFENREDVSWELSSTKVGETEVTNWIELTDIVMGPNKGKVYVYSEDGITPKVIDEQFTKEKVYILKNNELIISQNVDLSKDFNMDFHGYMVQVIDGKTATEVFTTGVQ